MKKLRAGYLSTMYHTSHIIKGLKWVEKYLNVEAKWSLFGTGPSMIEAFSRGALDIGYIGLPPAMIGIGDGLPLKCIGGGHAEGTLMIGRKDSFLLNAGRDTHSVLKQLEGRMIGSPAKGSIHDVIIRFLIKHHGLKHVKVKNYPWADLMPEAITEGEIDAAVGTPPLAVLAKKWYGHSVIIPPAHIWPFNPSYGIVVKESILGEEKLLKGFLTIHEKACNLIREKPDEAAHAVSDEVKVVDTAFIKEVFSVSPLYCASLPDEYIKATMTFVPALKEAGYSDQQLTREDIFELSLIKKVHPDPHHYCLKGLASSI